MSRPERPDKATLLREAGGLLLRKGKVEIPLSESEAYDLLDLLARTLPAGPKRDYALLVRRHRVMLDLAASIAEQSSSLTAQLLRLLKHAEAITEGHAHVDERLAPLPPLPDPDVERPAPGGFVVPPPPRAAGGDDG